MKNELNTTINKQDNFKLSVIPVRKDKTPYGPWYQYQSIISPIESWHKHFLDKGYVGVITGKVSGGLEILDFDLKNDPDKTIFNEFKKIVPHDLLRKLIVQTTVNGGYHMIYSCPDGIEKNLKLAKSKTGEVIIETRGEGGYFCHQLDNYKVLNGVFDLTNLNVEIPVISSDEREALLYASRLLNRHAVETTNSYYKEASVNNFNSDYNILDLFSKHNWSIVKEEKDRIYLKRPGSNSPHSGYYFLDTKTFFCFSSSTDFEPSKPYNHFQILQVLEQDKDYRSCLRRLNDLGYPSQEKQLSQKKKENTSWDMIADYLNESGVRYDTFIQELTLNGRTLEEKIANTLYINLNKDLELDIPINKFEQVLKSDFILDFNPLEQFIKDHEQIITTHNFERWLDCITLKNKTLNREYILHFLKKWYVGIIAQAMNGKFPNEFFLSLISPVQGIGKTTLLRRFLLPVELQKYVAEQSLSLTEDFKVMMSQALLIIDDEMDGRTYETDKSFKSLLSTNEISTRRKYDRRISKLQRRASFAGSGNNVFIVRERLNRRIIPLEIEYINHKMLDELDLDAMFMEAYRLYISGFNYSFQSTDTQMLEQLFEDYRQVTELEEIINEMITNPVDDKDIFYITSMDLQNILLGSYTNASRQINNKSVGNQLVDKGIERVRKGKNKSICYAISKSSEVIKHLRPEDNTFLYNNPDEFKTILYYTQLWKSLNHNPFPPKSDNNGDKRA